jgi:hypothetical protein
MPVYSPPPVEPVRTSLTMGDHAVDLATRALVVAVVPSPRWAREAEVVAGVRAAADGGADLVEVPADPRLLGPAAQLDVVPVAVRVTTPSAAKAASAAGASLLLVPAESLDVVTAGDGLLDPAGEPRKSGEPGERRGAVPGRPLAVMVQDIAGIQRFRSGSSVAPIEGELPVAFDSLHLTDVDLVAETTLALSVGARLVRTHDIRKVRRVVEVIAAVLEVR